MVHHQELLQAEQRRVVGVRSTEVSYPRDAHVFRSSGTSWPEATAHGLEHDGVGQHDQERGIHRRRGLGRHDVRHVRQLLLQGSRSVVWETISNKLRCRGRELIRRDGCQMSRQVEKRVVTRKEALGQRPAARLVLHHSLPAH